MAGFLTNLGLAAGRNILYGQEYQERQADIDLKKQQVQLGQLALQQKQTQMQSQQAIGNFLQSEAQKDTSNITDPAQTAKMYQKAAGLALQSGDFVSANTMEELAKGSMQNAKEQAVVVQQQQQVKKEALANAASDYAANPSSEGAQDLMRKAVDAGVNPSQIPTPGTPQWGSWVNQQSLASKTAAQRADFVQKAYEMDQNRQEKQREHNDNVQLRQAQMAQSAQVREAMINIQKGNLQLRTMELEDRQSHRADTAPSVKDFGGSTYQYDPTGKVAGDRDLPDQGWVKMGEKLTAQQKTGVSRGSYSASEVARSLDKILQFDPGTTGSPFAHLGAKTPLEAMVKIGSNKLTPAQYQAMTVNAAGLGNQIASLESALGGRMAAGTQQQHLQDMAVPQPGDSGYTAAYKVANAKELTITALKHLPGNYANTAAGKEQIAELEKSVPFSTNQIIDLMKKDPNTKSSDAAIRKMLSDTQKVESNVANAAAGLGGGTGLPGSGDAGAGLSVPPIPAGWSVKAH